MHEWQSQSSLASIVGPSDQATSSLHVPSVLSSEKFEAGRSDTSLAYRFALFVV